MASEDVCYLRSDRHMLSTPPNSKFERIDFEFSPLEEQDTPRMNQEYKWLLETELPQALEDIAKLLSCCNSQLEFGTSSVDQRALLIPDQTSEYVTGTLHLEGNLIPRADLLIKPSPKSSNKSRVSTTIKGVSNSWKLPQITDASNQLKLVSQRFSHLLHRQDLQQISPKPLLFLISDIIENLQVFQNIFEIPKRPKLKDIQADQGTFKPALPEDIIINIYFSSFYLVITIFYLSTTPHRHQLHNTKPIVSISQQESLINSVLDGVGGKELEVIFQGEGSCAVPHVKLLLNYVRICLLHCQTLSDKINCFADI